jgi:hypothetical protein
MGSISNGELGILAYEGCSSECTIIAIKIKIFVAFWDGTATVPYA